MGRKPTKNLNLPARMRARKRANGKTYYFYDAGGMPRKEIPLGTDYVIAVQKWSELEVNTTSPHKELITFRYVAERYMREVIPTKSSGSQRDNLQSLKPLFSFFDNPPIRIDQIEPVHVRQYLDWRKKAPVRANRDKALLSAMFNKAREWGYTSNTNPCAGVKGYKETGRKVYITDTLYKQAYSVACEPLRDALDLAYLTGQRPADVLRFSERNIDGNLLIFRQGKTDTPVRIEIVGELKKVIARIKRRKSGLKIHSLALVVNENGQPLGKDALRSRFDKARDLAGIDKKDYQIRDLRAKAATEKTDHSGIKEAQKQLGHSSVTMTEQYVRARAGDRVKPTK